MMLSASASSRFSPFVNPYCSSITNGTPPQSSPLPREFAHVTVRTTQRGAMAAGPAVAAQSTAAAVPCAMAGFADSREALAGIAGTKWEDRAGKLQRSAVLNWHVGNCRIQFARRNPFSRLLRCPLSSESIMNRLLPTSTLGWLSVACSLAVYAPARAQSIITSWGMNASGQLPGTMGNGVDAVSMSAGVAHTAVILTDGSIRVWGSNEFGCVNAPKGSFTAVAAGDNHCIGLIANGSLVGWGKNTSGQCNVPSGAFIAIAAGGMHSAAIKARDGNAVCWGSNGSGQCNALVGPFTAITAGGWHTAGLRSNGTAACWGWNAYGQCSAPSATMTQIDAGSQHTVGLKSNTAVVCWGSNFQGQCTAPAGPYVRVAAGEQFSVALRSDGRVIAWGLTTGALSYSPRGAFPQLTAGGAFIAVAGQMDADFDGDGMVTGIDLALLLASWGTSGADIDHDGTTAGGDLALLLADWIFH